MNNHGLGIEFDNSVDWISARVELNNHNGGQELITLKEYLKVNNIDAKHIKDSLIIGTNGQPDTVEFHISASSQRLFQTAVASFREALEQVRSPIQHQAKEALTIGR